MKHAATGRSECREIAGFSEAMKNGGDPAELVELAGSGIAWLPGIHSGDHVHLDGHALGVMAFLFFLIILGHAGGDWGDF